MVLILDLLGQRYGMLPSRFINEASTFDLVIMDMALAYERYSHESHKEGYIPEMSIDELQKIKERSR